MSDEETVRVQRANRHHVITLQRPDKLNALDDQTHRGLHRALDGAKDDPECRAVLLTGSGRGFCVGQDLADLQSDRADGGRPLGDVLEEYYLPLVRRLRALEMPVVCAVNGVAAGAGANIAFACDVVLAARSAKFIQSFAKIGLIPDAGGSWFLTRSLGPARAMGLALTAEPLSAETAESWGLIWKVVDDEVLMPNAIRLVEELASGPTIAYALIKRAVSAATTHTLDEQLELEQVLQDRAGRTSDYAEGVRAFLERRPAKFTGKE
ncbi:MAG: 2-(1,2-epoxy-1,2-dihydrophenyl)acetyl-CoA isomerase PaaG [Myxococcota bacterium]